MKIKTLLDGTPIDEDQFLKWIKALESGKYNQTQFNLENKEGYCCLGVACKVIIPENQLLLKRSSCYLNGESPVEQRYSPNWLKYINTDVKYRSKNFFFQAGLMVANDRYRKTFTEIAAELRNIYIEGSTR